MTNRRPTILALAAFTLLAPALASPEAASASWVSVQGSFSIGGVAFGLGWATAPRYYGQPASPYYRVAVPLAHPVYRCSSACYRADGVYYHHASCPLVLHHFRSFGYAPPHLGLSIGYGGVLARPYAYRVAPPPYLLRRAPAPRIAYPGWRDDRRSSRYAPGWRGDGGRHDGWHDGRRDGRHDRRHERRRARPRHHR